MFLTQGLQWAVVIVGCFGLALLTQCANPVTPSGGPKDTTPPDLVLEESTANQQTGFQKQDIRLTYDEWVQLKDAPSQVIISPPLEFNPEITLKGKTVVYAFDDDEVLSDSTTYTINFGKAISDLTESNPVENFVFVFSTGSFIDSLSIKGTVTNAETGKPEADTYVILHHDLTDTAIATLRPAYFTQTDKNGAFTMQFIRQDTFRIYALKDQNLNYRYDQQSEVFGFYSGMIHLTADSVPFIRLHTFTADPERVIIQVNQSSNGIVKIVLSAMSDSLELTSLRGTLPDRWVADKDTLRIWHRNADTTEIEVRHGNTVLDTITLRPFVSNERTVSLRLVSGRILHPDDTCKLHSATPLTDVTQGLVVTLNDSIQVEGCRISLDSLDRQIVYLGCPWEENGKYKIIIPGGAVTDYFGRSNDTLDLNLSVLPRENFGEIRVEVNGLDSNFIYLLHLMDGQDLVRQARLDPMPDAHSLVFTKLPAKSYSVRLVEDRNGNGRWDPGDFATLSQPERLLFKEIEPLRAGWDLDVTVTWSEQ